MNPCVQQFGRFPKRTAVRLGSAFFLAATAAPAWASREVDSWRVVPKLLASLVGDASETVLLSAGILGMAMLGALFVWARRTSQTRSRPELYFTLPNPPVSGPNLAAPTLTSTSSSAPGPADSTAAAQQRQAEMKARVEALTLRPRSTGFSAVDADARARIAAAASRMEARARAARLEHDQAGAQAGSSDD